MNTKIIANFNGAANTYNNYCSIQRTVCQYALDQLLVYRNTYENIIDIACGTGNSLAALTTAITYKFAIGIDWAEKLLEKCQYLTLKKSAPQLLIADFNQLPFTNACFDLVFCNMGLQWSSCLANSIKNFSSLLTNGGHLLITIPSLGNFPELQPLYRNPLPSGTWLAEQMIKNNLTIQHHSNFQSTQHFPSQAALLKSIKYVGAHTLLQPQSSTRNTLLGKNSLSKFFVNPHSKALTYHIDIMLASKYIS